MGNPSQAEIETQLQNATALLEAVRIRGVVTVDDNIAERVDALTQSLEGVYSGQKLTAANSIRRSYAQSISQTAVRQVLEPILLEEARRIGSPNLSADQLLQDVPGSIFRQFVTAGRRIKSRGFTLGSVTPGSGNAGDGTVVRVSVDRHGNPLEGAYAPKDSPVTLICTADSVVGTAQPGQETFQLYGREIGVDALDERGTPAQPKTVTAKSALESATALTNPSFSQAAPNTDGADVTELVGWVPTGALSNLQTVLSDTYRPQGRETVSRSLRFKVSETITTSAPLRSLDQTRPYVVQIAFKREASCDGTLTLNVGSVSAAVTLSAQTGWTVLRLPLDHRAWAANWTGAPLTLSIALSSRTTGTLLVDDVVVAPLDEFDGLYYGQVGGETRSEINDAYTFTDSEAGAIIGRWISRGWPGRYLPATLDATQVTASGGRQLTFAASGNTITATSGDFASDGYKPGMAMTVAGTSDNNGTFTITDVTATVITVAESLVNEGPLASMATLDATASLLDPVVA